MSNIHSRPPIVSGIPIINPENTATARPPLTLSSKIEQLIRRPGLESVKNIVMHEPENAILGRIGKVGVLTLAVPLLAATTARYLAQAITMVPLMNLAVINGGSNDQPGTLSHKIVDYCLDPTRMHNTSKNTASKILMHKPENIGDRLLKTTVLPFLFISEAVDTVALGWQLILSIPIVAGGAANEIANTAISQLHPADQLPTAIATIPISTAEATIVGNLSPQDLPS